MQPLNRGVSTISIPSAARLILVAAVTAVAASCAGKTPAQPTPALVISSISPSSGPSIGGTAITVIGSNFGEGAALTIGGVAALNVTVVDPTMIQGTTGPAAGGPADVVVALGGRTARLVGGFVYMRLENAPPLISSVTAQGTRLNEPANFADLDEEINVVAVVTNEEASPNQLSYEWSAGAGTFVGTGSSVKWRAPRTLPTTPISYPLTVTVTEQYQTTDDIGAVVTRENKASEKVTVRVHDSNKEVTAVAAEFMNDFSNSLISAESAVRNFSDSQICGKTQERNEIRDNRATYTITDRRLTFPPKVTFNFNGTCPFRARPGDACVQLSCGWTSMKKATGVSEIVNGTCLLTEIYDVSDKWQMCWSDFEPTPAKPTTLHFPF
jgi:IPT/TIG domain